jgi:hypothetical protein
VHADQTNFVQPGQVPGVVLAQGADSYDTDG